MERVVASVMNGDVAVVEDALIYLDAGMSSHGVQTWRAFVGVPRADVLAIGAQLRLEVIDGRVGDVLVSQMRADDDGRFTFTLTGTGPLERPGA